MIYQTSKGPVKTLIPLVLLSVAKLFAKAFKHVTEGLRTSGRSIKVSIQPPRPYSAQRTLGSSGRRTAVGHEDPSSSKSLLRLIWSVHFDQFTQFSDQDISKSYFMFGKWKVEKVSLVVLWFLCWGERVGWDTTAFLPSAEGSVTTTRQGERPNQWLHWKTHSGEKPK